MGQEYIIVGRDDEYYEQDVPLLHLEKSGESLKVRMFGRYHNIRIQPVVPMARDDSYTLNVWTTPIGYGLQETNHVTVIHDDGRRNLMVVECYESRKKSGYLNLSNMYVHLWYGEGKWFFSYGFALDLTPDGMFQHGAVYNRGIVVYHYPGILEELTNHPSVIPM